MDKGTIDFATFRRELENLCDKYHVLIKEERVRREDLYNKRPKYYSVELSFKVPGGIENDWIVE